MQIRHYKVVILGGGTGGVCVAARLRKQYGHEQVAIVEPSSKHYYQPLWTLVGAGIVSKESTVRSQKSVTPPGVVWIADRVKRVYPEQKMLETVEGRTLHYEALVVATGLQLDFDKIDGLRGNLGRRGIHSIYEYDGAEKTAVALKCFTGGRAVFIMPPVPIKCAGAPQKIMYLADELFRRRKIREKTQVVFACAGKVIFGVPEFAKPLTEVIRRKNIQPLFGYRLIKVNAEKKQATFEVTSEGGTQTEEMAFDFLHVVPPMSAHSYVRESGLAFEQGPHAGWLEVDPNTLQHPRFPSVFGIGDVTGVPNSKTGAAVRKQAPVVVQNLKAFLAGEPLVGRYDGYSSCPLVTQKGRVILAEFGYGGKLLPSLPLDPTKERWTMWVLKRYLLPRLYWYGMLPGRA